jgi:hypothetical protein
MLGGLSTCQVTTVPPETAFEEVGRIRNDKSASRLECRIPQRCRRNGCHARFSFLIRRFGSKPLIPEKLHLFGWTGNGKRPAWRLQSSRRRWFEAHVVVHRVAKALLTAEVSLRRLDAHMAEQKLDLLKLTTGFVAQTRACTP